MVKIDSKENLIRLVNEYKNLIFSICLKLTGDYFAAEDITQDTFICAYQNYEGFDGNNEKAWLCRIAGNKCIDYLKSARYKRNIYGQEVSDAGDESLNPLRIYENREIIEQLTEACMGLKEPYSSVSKYHFVEGLSAAEIARRTGTNLKTVQTQIYRSKEMLKKIIRREDLIS